MKLLGLRQTNFVGCIDELCTIFFVVSPVMQVGVKSMRMVLQCSHSVMLLWHQDLIAPTARA
jgi:hypothetical protein